MKSIALFAAIVVLTGCSRVSVKAPSFPDSEKGYHHLMQALKDRAMSTCEDLKYDGRTCLNVKGTPVCGKTRDEAAELAATWIEENIAVISCLDCQPSEPKN